MHRGPNLLSDYLLKTGITYRELGGRLGVAASQICRWLNGRVPSLTAGLRLEELTGGAVPAESWTKRKRNSRA